MMSRGRLIGAQAGRNREEGASACQRGPEGFADVPATVTQWRQESIETPDTDDGEPDALCRGAAHLSRVMPAFPLPMTGVATTGVGSVVGEGVMSLEGCGPCQQRD